jgi:hypothetical protein
MVRKESSSYSGLQLVWLQQRVTVSSFLVAATAVESNDVAIDGE